MVNERLAKHRAAVLRPILEIEKRGEPISAAIGDAAWELGLAKSHTWSLYRRLRENDARAAALELGRRGPKPGSKRIAQGVEDIIEATLRGIAKLLTSACEVLVKRVSGRHFDGVIVPKVERIRTGVAV